MALSMLSMNDVFGQSPQVFCVLVGEVPQSESPDNVIEAVPTDATSAFAIRAHVELGAVVHQFLLAPKSKRHIISTQPMYFQNSV